MGFYHTICADNGWMPGRIRKAGKKNKSSELHSISATFNFLYSDAGVDDVRPGDE
jgi:hypothetical protein